MNPLGKYRHFTPAAQEWHNSVYTYNNHYLKTLPTADFNMFNILKSYLNSQIKIKNLAKKRKRKGRTSKRKFRFKSSKSIFVGKGDIKHSNDRVIITLFLYNAEKMYLKFHFNKWKKKLFYPNKRFKIKINEIFDPKKKEIIVRARRHNIYELLDSQGMYKLYIKHINFCLKRFNQKIKKFNNIFNTLNKFTILNDKDKLKVLDLIYKFKTFDYPKINIYISKIPRIFILAKLKLYIILLNYNKLKHKYSYLCKLIPSIENIYRKKVIFNFVNLKRRHLNSDIYTQIVSLKLKNRDNKLYRVLRLSLRRITIPVIRRIGRINQVNIPG